MRPFTRCFLRTLSKKYTISVYSVLPQKFLNYILKMLQKDRICITNILHTDSTSEVKNLTSFWSKGSPNKANSVIVDHDARTAVVNSGNAVPVIYFKGVTSKDSVLLYLEKYLLDLAMYEDVRGKLQNDFGIGIQKVKKMNTNLF